MNKPLSSLSPHTHKDFIGIFFISFAILLFEVLSSRILSAVFLKHYSYIVITLALLGFTLGGLFMCKQKKNLENASISRFLVQGSLAFSISVFFALFVYLFLAGFGINFANNLAGGFLENLAIVLLLIIVAVFVAAPFFFGGNIIARATVYYAKNAGLLYAYDLFGAALGAITAVVFLPLLGAVGSLCLVILAALIAVVLFLEKLSFLIKITVPTLLVICIGITIIDIQSPLFLSVTGNPKYTFSKWNTISHIIIVDPLEISEKGFISWRKTDDPFSEKEKAILIDSDALTPLTPISNGNPRNVPQFKHALVSAPFRVQQGEVLVIGAGGGADVLTALQFPKNKVTAAEVNPLVAKLARENYGSFIGHVYDHPDVNFVIEEARSYVRNTDKKFDVIMMSLVDTWAASARGSFSTVENYLYTTEAIDDYLAHLNDDGILTITRWNFETDILYRLFESSFGKQEFSQHLLILNHGPLSSFLVKKSPWTKEESDKISTFAKTEGYEFKDNYTVKNDSKYAGSSDDKPFFFQSGQKLSFLNINKNNWVASRMLIITFWIILATVILFILYPIRWIDKNLRKVSFLPLAYFFFVGLSFFIAEISLIQKLVLFVGNPMITLAMLLGGILLFSAIGSAVAEHFAFKLSKVAIILLVPVLLIIFQYVLTPILYNLLGLSGWSRILLALLSIAPVGIVMGMPFSYGTRYLKNVLPDIVGWAWIVNSAASVLGSVGALILSIQYGFSVSLSVAAACYFIAIILFVFFMRQNKKLI